jgi:anti-sigma regulatory factor (Ser/Thr protein kinase)
MQWLQICNIATMLDLKIWVTVSSGFASSTATPPPPEVTQLLCASDRSSLMPEVDPRQAVLPAPLIWSSSYPGSADQAQLARQFLTGVMDGHPLTCEAVACLGELTANAIVHSNSRQPGGSFSVQVFCHADGRMRVEVTDQGGPWTPIFSEDGRHGRGLLIVSQLADNWGISGDSKGGRTAWFELTGPPRADIQLMVEAQQ